MNGIIKINQEAKTKAESLNKRYTSGTSENKKSFIQL